MMRNNLKRKAFFGILLVILINAISLTFWFQVWIIPVINKTQDLENNIINNDLKESYDTESELIEEIGELSSLYNIKIILVDKMGSTINDETADKEDIFLFSDVVRVGDDNYIVSVYSSRSLSTARIIMQLIVFQIVFVSICMTIVFLVTRSKILMPIDQIIANIRNYKLGKAPVKYKLGNEFDLIQDEFFKLATSLDEEKNEQNRIIASISHDIKTPLTSVIGYATLIDESNLSKEEMKQYNRKIKEKSLTIKSILSDFDDYLVNQTNSTLKLDSMEIKTLIDDLNNDYKVDLESKNISFEIITDLGGEEVITIDILKMKRIFANVISNSTRYLNDNGKIKIEISKDDNNFIFKISDNGPGTSEKIIDKIFDPLFTTDKSRKISGLGLSIVKEFVLLHKGEITAYNDNGFVIEFTIPVDLKKMR